MVVFAVDLFHSLLRLVRRAGLMSIFVVHVMHESVYSCDMAVGEYVRDLRSEISITEATQQFQVRGR